MFGDQFQRCASVERAHEDNGVPEMQGEHRAVHRCRVIERGGHQMNAGRAHEFRRDCRAVVSSAPSADRPASGDWWVNRGFEHPWAFQTCPTCRTCRRRQAAPWAVSRVGRQPRCRSCQTTVRVRDDCPARPRPGERVGRSHRAFLGHDQRPVAASSRMLRTSGAARRLLIKVKYTRSGAGQDHCEHSGGVAGDNCDLVAFARARREHSVADAVRRVSELPERDPGAVHIDDGGLVRR